MSKLTEPADQLCPRCKIRWGDCYCATLALTKPVVPTEPGWWWWVARPGAPPSACLVEKSEDGCQLEVGRLRLAAYRDSVWLCPIPTPDQIQAQREAMQQAREALMATSEACDGWCWCCECTEEERQPACQMNEKALAALDKILGDLTGEATARLQRLADEG